MCPRMSSSWPATFQQRSVPVLHPPPPLPPPPHAPGHWREAAVEESGRSMWKWLSTAPGVPDTVAHDVPYPKLQRHNKDIE